MISKLIKAGVAAAALLAMPFDAIAADMKTPVYKGVPRSVIAYYNWSGFYLGGTVGYGSGSSEWTDTVLGTTLVSTSPKGMLYGLTAGYNWQAGSWVYGIEGDYSFSNIKGSTVCVGVITCETSNSFLATFRGRIGYAMDRFMPYLTAGGAYGDIQAAVSAPIVGTLLTDSETKLGMAVGAGIEYAFLASWSAKLEYLYVDLGKFQSTLLTDVSFNTHLIRAGVNYRF